MYHIPVCSVILPLTQKFWISEEYQVSDLPSPHLPVEATEKSKKVPMRSKLSSPEPSPSLSLLATKTSGWPAPSWK